MLRLASLITVVFVSSFVRVPMAAATQPNIVIFIADDVSWDDIACYGNQSVQTPRIDELAAGGLRFMNAYLTASSCSPSRNSILLGRYPHNTGAAELHSRPPSDEVVSFPEMLKNNGYFTIFSGKYHQGHYAQRAFHVISRKYEEITNSGEGMWLQNLKDRPRDKPFFMWLAALDAHRDWGENRFGGTHDPANVAVPPYLADTPETRQDLAQYYDEIYRFDYHIGLIVDELKAQGAYDNTLLIVMADNGRPFPHSKTQVNDRGMKTPLIMHWPNRISTAAVSNSLVSVIDLAPTLVEIAGVDPIASFQGRSFTALLDDPQQAFRNYVFAEHNWHDYEAHQRMVRDARFMYIRNKRSNLSLLGPADSVGSPAHRDLVALKAQGRLTAIQHDIFVTPRPYETLFDCQADPGQLLNRASVPDYAGELDRLRSILDRWIEETGDSAPAHLTGDWYLKQPGTIKTDEHGIRGEMPGASKHATEINAKGPF